MRVLGFHVFLLLQQGAILLFLTKLKDPGFPPPVTTVTDTVTDPSPCPCRVQITVNMHMRALSRSSISVCTRGAVKKKKYTENSRYSDQR